jgi:inosine-uridine nucleoside N-ribohydrolase
MAKPVIIDFVPHAGGMLGFLVAAGSPDLDIRALTVTVTAATYEQDMAAAVRLKGFLPPGVPLGVGATKPIIPLPQAAVFARGVRFPGITPPPPPPLNPRLSRRRLPSMPGMSLQRKRPKLREQLNLSPWGPLPLPR